MFFLYGVCLALWVVDDGNWCSPIPLTRDEPVTEFVGNNSFPPTFLFEIIHRFLHSYFEIETIEEIRVDHLSPHRLVHDLFNSFNFCCIAIFTNHNSTNWYTKFLRELKISFVMTRTTLYSTSPHVHQNKITNPNRNVLSCNVIQYIRSGENSRFIFC